jgi:hypothetical protein
LKYRGRVMRQSRGGESKSARDAVILETPEAALVLRIQGGNAFRDSRLENLVGKRIEAEGVEHAGTLIITTWKEID